MLLWAWYAHDHVSRTSFTCCIASVTPSLSATLCFFFLSRCRVIHLRVVPYLAGRATDFSIQWVVTTGRPQETCQDKSRVQNFIMQELRCRRSAWCETQASVERHCLSGQGGATPSHPTHPSAIPAAKELKHFRRGKTRRFRANPLLGIQQKLLTSTPEQMILDALAYLHVVFGNVG